MKDDTSFELLQSKKDFGRKINVEKIKEKISVQINLE
jgi:hypothetical protein